MRGLLIIPLAVLALLAGAMAWSRRGPVGRADFTFINRGEIGTLDPNRMSWLQDIRVGYGLWEGLYALDPQTLKAVPGCAEPIELSEDKLVYTFHIRPTARWSNGDHVTTHDFIFAWRRMLQEPGDYTSLLYYIAGAKEYQEAFAKFGEKFTAASEAKQPTPAEPDFGTVGMTALDNLTLRVTLKHPVGFFPDICAFPPTFPLNEKSMGSALDKSSLEKTGRRNYRKDYFLPPKLITNGPYKLATWEFKRRVRLEANEYYWNRDKVQSKTIDMLAADDPLWALNMYDTGGVDWVAETTGELAAELLARGRTDVHVFPGFGTYFYTFNCQPKFSDGRVNPFADVRVRQAFSMAVDKQPIVDRVTRLGEPITTKYIPPYAFAGYESPSGLAYDKKAAQKLLADAGYPNGKGFPPLTLLFNSEGQHAPIAQIIHRQWLDVLNVDMKLEGIEIKTFRTRLHNKDYAVARASWYGDYNDPSTFTDKYKSDSDNNDSAWINKKFDDLCAAADVEKDDAQRLQLFSQAEKLLLDEAPILPLYHYMNVYLYRDNVTGIPLNSRMQVMLHTPKVMPAGDGSSKTRRP